MIESRSQDRTCRSRALCMSVRELQVRPCYGDSPIAQSLLDVINSNEDEELRTEVVRPEVRERLRVASKPAAVDVH